MVVGGGCLAKWDREAMQSGDWVWEIGLRVWGSRWRKIGWLQKSRIGCHFEQVSVEGGGSVEM